MNLVAGVARLGRALGRSVVVVAARSAGPGVELPLQQRLARSRGRRFLLIAGLAAILLWQWSLMGGHGLQGAAASRYRIEASAGFLGWQSDFVYFLYYLGLYPIATTDTLTREDYSTEGARRVIATRGSSLVMDRLWTIRYGELGKTYLYLPDAYRKGNAHRTSMVLSNAGFFALSLAALFVSFWWLDQPVLGFVIVMLMGSNPFQVNEAHDRSNVFGWTISTTLAALAFHLPLLAGRRPRLVYRVLLPVLTGLCLATVRQVRTEPLAVILAVALAYLTASLRWRERLLLLGLLGLSFALGAQAWAAHFDAKFREAYDVVKRAGGLTYDGPRQRYHFFWHAVWCGLGDFDHKYGYQWNDVAAKDYALPILEERYGFRPEGYPAPKLERYGALTLGVYWDRDRQYPRTPFEVPEYALVMRDKVLHDIAHDPLWYLGILGRRALRLLTNATPPSLTAGDGRIWSLPGSPVYGFLTLPVAAVLLRVRSAFFLKLLAFTVPLAFTALLVHSGGGTVYYSVLHLMAFALVVAWCIEAGLACLHKRLLLGWVWGGKLYVVPGQAAALEKQSPAATARADGR